MKYHPTHSTHRSRMLVQAGGIALAALLLLPGPANAQEAPAPPETEETVSTPSPDPVAEAIAILDDESLSPQDRVTRLQALAEANPKEGQLWAALGEAWEGAGDGMRALAAFDRAVEMDGTLYSAWYRVGILNKRLRLDLGRAELAFLRALDHGAKPGPTYNELGVTMAVQGRMDDAIAYFDRGAKEEPGWGVLLNNAIKAALADGKHKRAREYFLLAIEAERFEENAIMLWGESLVARGKHKDAAADYRLALDKHPENPRIRYYYGAALSEGGGKKEDAIRELNAARISAEAQQDPRTRRNIDRLLFAVENPKDEKAFKKAVELVFKQEQKEEKFFKNMNEALEDLDKIVAKHPTFYNGLFMRGYVHRALGSSAEAKADLLRALELSPGEPNAAIQLALLHRDLGEQDAAIARARLAVEQAPLDPTILLNAGFIELDSNHCEEAKALAARVEAMMGPDSAAPLRDEIGIRCK